MTNFYDSIKYYDLSKLWRTDSVLNLELIDDTISSDPRKFAFPEPIGFIGSNYQRFYVHFLSVRKDKKNPYIYDVTGKTRVKNNICRFAGTMTIDTARYYIDTLVPQFQSGYVICKCIFYEDSTKSMSGCITGTIGTDWCIYHQQIYYDNVYGIADGYSNNQFTGVWQSYHSGFVKKCNWGDWRIPESKGLDIGAGEFSVIDEYVKNGWQSYHDANTYGDSVDLLHKS
jgi:hypothetical protein